MLAHIPVPQPDQTMESLAALAAIRNGVPCKNAEKLLFGTRLRCGVEVPFHRGTSHLFTKLQGAGYVNCCDFLDNHGLIGFFRPFVSKMVYQEAREKMIQDNIQGIPRFLHANGDSPFVKRRRYCPTCAHMEFQSLGYAYAHRAHQIRGMCTCPEHGCSLREGSEYDFHSKEMWGLLLPKPGLQFENFAFKGEPSNSADERKIGPWVNAIFTGAVLTTEASVRTQLIAEKLSAMQKATGLPNSLPSRLDHIIRHTFSEEYLSHLGFARSEGPAAHGESGLISKFEVPAYSMAKMLVLSALFDSPSHFNQAAENRTNPNDSAEHGAEVRMCGGYWHLSLRKDILRARSLTAVAIKHGISRRSMETHLDRYPNLLGRRKIFQEKLTKKRHQGVLLKAILENSNLTRSTFQRANLTSYVWLRLNDQTWFSNQLPPQGYRASREKEKIATLNQCDMDERFVDMLTEKAMGQLNADVPKRINRSLLITGLGQNLQGQISSQIFPRTVQLISSLVETTKAYEHRVLNRLQELVRLRNHDRIKRWSTSLIEQFSHRPDILARVEELIIGQYAEPDDVRN